MKCRNSIIDHLKEHGPKQRTQLAWELFKALKLCDGGMGLVLGVLEKRGEIYMDRGGYWYICRDREG